jgi:hypothetical protein
LARDLRLRLRLATAPGAIARLASVHQWPLGLHRRRLDLGLGRAVRLGDVSLRTLDAPAQYRLDLGAGR